MLVRFSRTVAGTQELHRGCEEERMREILPLDQSVFFPRVRHSPGLFGNRGTDKWRDARRSAGRRFGSRRNHLRQSGWRMDAGSIR